MSRANTLYDCCLTVVLFGFRDLVAELPFILMHPKPDDDLSLPPTGRGSPSKVTGDNVEVDNNLIELDT